MSMDDVTQTPAHAKPARRDHLWVLVVIAGFALYDVWEAWTQVGNKSGFAHGTGWTLTVIVEAFAGYVLWGWFNAPGVRSRRFAMWSAFGMLALSLAGQASSHLTHGDRMPPPLVVVFVSVLPVITLALAAILVHLRRLDRADAEAAEQARAEAGVSAQRASAEAGRIAHLEGELGALTERLSASESAHADAEKRAAEALTRAETAEQRLAAKSAQAKRAKSAQDSKKNAHDEDLTLEFRALDELQKDPSLRAPRMGGELARRIGASPATGRRLHAKLTAQHPSPESLTERSADPSDERSGERS